MQLETETRLLFLSVCCDSHCNRTFREKCPVQARSGQPWFSLNALSAPLPCETRSNSFHSTFEPNTEVFSKVSRSLAQFILVNSFSTLQSVGTFGVSNLFWFL